MLAYVIKRCLTIVPIILGVVVLVFTIINLVPGDPGRRILGATATQEAVDQLNHELGVDKPFITRLWDYISAILRFDFGVSYQSMKPVSRTIQMNFKYTFRLAVLMTIGYVVIGITLGVLSAVKQYSALDNVTRVVSVTLSAFPSFWFYIMAILLFSLQWKLLPSGGVESWKSYVLPVGCASILNASGLQRMTRTTMLETIRQDFVRTARAKGCAKGTVIWRHAFLNAALPIINSVGHLRERVQHAGPWQRDNQSRQRQGRTSGHGLHRAAVDHLLRDGPSHRHHRSERRPQSQGQAGRLGGSNVRTKQR